MVVTIVSQSAIFVPEPQSIRLHAEAVKLLLSIVNKLVSRRRRRRRRHRRRCTMSFRQAAVGDCVRACVL